MLNLTFFRMKTTIKKNRIVRPEEIFKQLAKKLNLNFTNMPPLYVSPLNGYKEMFGVDISDYKIEVHYSTSLNSTKIIIIEKMLCVTQGKYYEVNRHEVHRPKEIPCLKLRAVEKIKKRVA